MPSAETPSSQNRKESVSSFKPPSLWYFPMRKLVKINTSPNKPSTRAQASYSRVTTLCSGNLVNPQHFESPIDKSSFPNSWQFIREPFTLFQMFPVYWLETTITGVKRALVAPHLQCSTPTLNGLRLFTFCLLWNWCAPSVSKIQRSLLLHWAAVNAETPKWLKYCK